MPGPTPGTIDLTVHDLSQPLHVVMGAEFAARFAAEVLFMASAAAGRDMSATFKRHLAERTGT